jgi:uncharacterized protein
MEPPPDRSSPPSASRWARPLWLTAGLVFVVLGFVGALLPLMPTTIFLILAAGCFARSSPRLEGWLLAHPRFGPTLRAWRERGAIGRKGKLLACSGMAFGLAVFWSVARVNLWVGALVTLLILACAGFVVSRPEA